MLNTDLHLAELEQHMTRSQFVKNTLPTIRSIADDAKGKDQALASPVSPHTPLERPSLDIVVNRNRISKLGGTRSDSEGNPDSSVSDGCNLLVNAPYEGIMKGWEAQVETILKDFYNSIRNERLPLHGAPEDRGRQPSNASLSVVTAALRRTPSVLSKAPSENASFRGRPHEMRSATARFASKSRTRPRVYPSSTMGSSRTSLDDQSLWSPAASTWTKYSLGKTQTSFSAESLGSWRGGGQAIGFANAISQAIIREENKTEGLLSPTDQADLGGRTVALLEDDTLELHGPPWAKEGILRHKVEDKRTKDRGWTECFAVIEKGCMRMFSFTGHQGHSTVKGAFRHLRPQKHKPAGSTGGAGNVVGGGNWTENAQDLGSFTLRQTYAGSFAREHSKSQAYVWALTLPTGVIHAFAVGSPELREEWIATVNYWSARLSKEPLIGGVSNIEYGWGEGLLATVRDADGPLTSPPPTSNSGGGRDGPPSTSASATMYSAASRSASRSNSVSNNAPQLPENLALHSRTSLPHSASAGSRPPSSLGRASLDQQSAHSGTHRAGRLPGDRTVISDWRPPVSSMMESQLMEVDQRNALAAYVGELEVELKKHAELRGIMGRAVCFHVCMVDVLMIAVLAAAPERSKGH
jgi:hypothetical protein